MAGTKEIKQRIKSVKNTKKITKAMELVAASKMKRAIAKALSSRVYANYSWDLLTSVSERLDGISHPFFSNNTLELDSKKNGKSLFVLITSNSGLCGAYNSQIIKKTIANIKDIPISEVDIITIGKKGDGAMRRTTSNIIASFLELADNRSFKDILPISKMIISDFKKNKYNKVYIAYTDFISVLNQKARVKQILPIKKTEIKDLIDTIGENKKITDTNTRKKKMSYLFEGNINEIIELLANKLVQMQIFHMILESSASEQSSRMIAMKNASEAAGEMIEDLTLVFNKARQAGITQEISEISAGMASID